MLMTRLTWYRCAVYPLSRMPQMGASGGGEAAHVNTEKRFGSSHKEFKPLPTLPL